MWLNFVCYLQLVISYICIVWTVLCLNATNLMCRYTICSFIFLGYPPSPQPILVTSNLPILIFPLSPCQWYHSKYFLHWAVVLLFLSSYSSEIPRDTIFSRIAILKWLYNHTYIRIFVSTKIYLLLFSVTELSIQQHRASYSTIINI